MLTLYGKELASRLLLGTSQYPSPAIMAEAARASGAAVLTVSLRRESARPGGCRGILAARKSAGDSLCLACCSGPR